MVNNDPCVSLHFSLLGPVRAWRGSTELDLGSRQQRTTLAMLLLREGTVATLDELIRGMWWEEPPRSAVTTIRTYVYRLRGVLNDGADGTGRLCSVGGGYALPTAGDALDVSRFRRHTAAGAEAARRGDWPTAAAEHRAALQLSYGEPLAGTIGPYAQGQRARLDQLVTAARIDLLDAEVNLGRHREILPELAAMAAAHPLWEDLQAMLMTALYGSGRIADALQHYQKTRRALVDDLGVEPGIRLRAVHQRILACDPSLVPAAPASRTGPAVRRPSRPSAVRRARHHARISRLRLPR